MRYTNNFKLAQNEAIVALYIANKIKHRKYVKRPIKLEYNIISKTVKLSYKEVRSSIDRLVLKGKLIKWNAWEQQAINLYRRQNYYLLSE